MFFQLLKLKPFLNKNKHLVLMKEILESMVKTDYVRPRGNLNPIQQYTVRDTLLVYINRDRNRLEYIVVEPELKPGVEEAVLTIYMENPNCMSNYCIEKTIRRLNDEEIYNTYVNNPIEINYYYQKLRSGYGPLYPLILDPRIEEISGNSMDKYVQVIHRDYTWYGWMNTNLVLEEGEIDRLVLGLARRSGKHLSLAYPLAEGLTPEGMRISLTYGWEVSRKGSSFTVRKKPPRIISITELVDDNVVDAAIVSYLWLILELKGFIVIGGGMSSGKTTLLQALLTLIPPTRRVVTIEDTPEIMGSTGIWDPLTERMAINDNEANIDMYKLLKFSLRRRADYIVVGEVRGREARLLVQASRLGHGILTTIHGESAESIIERLIAPPISIPKKLLSNIWSIVIMENNNGRRIVSKVYEIDRRLNIVEIYNNRGGSGFSIEDIVDKTNRLKELLDDETLRIELTGRTVFIQQLVNKGVFSTDVLAEEITKYYYRELFVEEEARDGK